MAVCPHHCSLKDFLLVSCMLLLWGPVCFSDSLQSNLPAPSLTQQSPQGGGTVDLLCRAPDGYAGLLFHLNTRTEQVDELEFEQERQEAVFILRGEAAWGQELYCCIFQDRHRRYSQYSPYMQLRVAPPPQPFLSVEPHSGTVFRGQRLSFRCSAPLSQSPAPEAFFLLRTGEAAEGSLVSPVSLVSQYTGHSGSEVSFDIGPASGGEGGSYTCFYQVALPGAGHTNSTASRPVHITISELLPQPTLSLLAPDPGEKGETVQCSGPQAYPGAQFALFRLGSSLPVTSHNAGPARHTVYFTLPVLQPHAEQYQCQYSVLLGQHWRESERSRPLTVPSRKGEEFLGAAVSPPTSPPPSSGAPDWPLIAGCVSAVLLFLVVLTGLGIAVQRRVKALAEKKKRREEARFWNHLHSMDHTFDLSLRRISMGSQEPSSTAHIRTSSLSASRGPLSTFVNPEAS